jgi:hypothetical protein
LNELKFGESLTANAEPSWIYPEGVEARRVPSDWSLTLKDEGMVQTTNVFTVAKAIVVRKSLAF